MLRAIAFLCMLPMPRDDLACGAKLIRVISKEDVADALERVFRS